MSFLEEFSASAKICAGKVSRKADAAVEVSRLKYNENRLQKEISRSLKLLGAKVYKAYNTSDSSLDVSSDVTEIHDMYEQIKSIRCQIDELKTNEFSVKDSKEDTEE